ncbi:MAG TPA: AbrB/MazE/SpoVT family DNA-binding domain-containing protein [Firmicutes bacterium]|jgi:bifunctional DNA-binding transcriptional regulator/antitoxin component of YhaV-PrlF toxin-antitoxin module|nr:AbrB/MazE/SpoVT family DNA-binding domain-containing protein [Bacillota bacterium]
MKPTRRFIDSGWRLTIPKPMRQSLRWTENTVVCLHWDGFEITIRAPHVGCGKCPDISRVGALGKIVLPPRVREEAGLYPGQILTLATQNDEVIVSADDRQVRCSACGSEFDVRAVLPKVYLCTRCRDALQSAAGKTRQA